MAEKIEVNVDKAKDLASMAIQAVVAIALIVAMYYVSLYASMQDNLVQVTYGSKDRVRVAPGEITHETILGTDKRLTLSGRPLEHLSQSKNRPGGIQFSYSFWMQLPEPSAGPFRRVVLLRGDPQTAKFSSDGGEFQLPVAFCPLVLVTRNADHDVTISVHVNTDKELNFSSVHSVPNGASPVNFAKYNLVTITVIDAFGFGSPTETSLSCSVWLNQVEYKTVGPTSMGGLKLNSGNLYVLPSQTMGLISNGSANVKVKNVDYCNYVMSSDQIYDKIYKESEENAKPYRMRNTTSGTQAWNDISMAHLSV